MNNSNRTSRINNILSPIQRFLHTEASGGIILLVFTIIALIWANSKLSESYFKLWKHYVSLDFGIIQLKYSLSHWINDGLMVLFFLVVGLEIKRELIAGELSSLKKATLPIAGAIGGMLLPALIYLIFNFGKEGMPGWGIPMATDIAFVVGLISLFGQRFPVQLKIFVLALAIVDDIGAILVIAIFYTKEISTTSLILAMIILGLLVLLNKLKVRNLLVYTIGGVFLWLAVLKSGVHATIAGVLLAFVIPAKQKIDKQKFLENSKQLLEEFNKNDDEEDILKDEKRLNIVFELEKRCENVLTPLQRLENNLHPWVSFFIIPLFALANAGVQLSGSLTMNVLHPISIGIILGLFLGKQIGIFAFSYLAIKFKIAAKMESVNYLTLYGASIICAIGFTMSLFIANLAFESNTLLDISKIGILLASLVSAIFGYIVTKVGMNRI